MSEPQVSTEGNALWCEEKAAAFARSGIRSRNRAALASRHAIEATHRALLEADPSGQRTLFQKWAKRWIELGQRYARDAERSNRRAGKLLEAALAWHSAARPPSARIPRRLPSPPNPLNGQDA